ncbi:MAG: efflux RND transporter permease subunit, partial [Flavobacteriaceae bacterium]|nr:efflux RND transporter permease subunit [Flavobacteriaceae bacterium]
IGFNVDFFSLFSDFDPKIYVGGDNVVFWGPLAWTVIYGLFIATFLTLIIVPILFYLVHKFKFWMQRVFS